MLVVIGCISNQLYEQRLFLVSGLFVCRYQSAAVAVYQKRQMELGNLRKRRQVFVLDCGLTSDSPSISLPTRLSGWTLAITVSCHVMFADGCCSRSCCRLAALEETEEWGNV